MPKQQRRSALPPIDIDAILTQFREAGFLVNKVRLKNFGKILYEYLDDIPSRFSTTGWDIIASRSPILDVVTVYADTNISLVYPTAELEPIPDGAEREIKTLDDPDDRYIGTIAVVPGKAFKLLFIMNGEEEARASDLGLLAAQIAERVGILVDSWDY